VLIQTFEESLALAERFRLVNAAGLTLAPEVIPVVLVGDLRSEVDELRGAGGSGTMQEQTASWVPFVGWAVANQGGGSGQFGRVQLRANTKRVLIQKIDLYSPQGTALTAGVNTILEIGSTNVWAGTPATDSGWVSGQHPIITGGLPEVRVPNALLTYGTFNNATWTWARMVARWPATTVHQQFIIPNGILLLPEGATNNAARNFGVNANAGSAEISVTLYWLEEWL
jgi:hypothetical protein